MIIVLTIKSFFPAASKQQFQHAQKDWAHQRSDDGEHDGHGHSGGWGDRQHLLHSAPWFSVPADRLQPSPSGLPHGRLQGRLGTSQLSVPSAQTVSLCGEAGCSSLLTLQDNTTIAD